MEDETSPNNRILAVMQDSGLTSLTQEYGEVFVDGMLNDGPLKNIPIVGSIVGAIQFGSSIRETLMRKKIHSFLYHLKEIPSYKRSWALQKINNSEKYRGHVGETILELLDKIDSDGKPDILGKIFAAFIEEKVSFIDFLRSAHVVNSTFYYDLLELKEHYDGMHVKNLEIKDTLFGLTSTDYAGGYRDAIASEEETVSVKSKTILSDVGVIVVTIGMSEKSSVINSG